MTASRKGIGSDLAKVDAYQNTAADYAEISELDDAFFESGTTDLKAVIRRGRPPLGDAPKQAVSLRLDNEIVERFKASGPGWQTRVNDVLRKHMPRQTGGS